MSWFESFLLAVGLSMDSLAASIATGITLCNCRLRHILQIGAIVGVFHIAMISSGFLAGEAFGAYICSFDHWIAFGLLMYLGGRMIWQGIFNKNNAPPDGSQLETRRPLQYKSVFGMALATSIDALAVGASIAFLDTTIWTPMFMVGGVTFFFSAFGVYSGRRFGGKIRLNFNILGGLILAGIGCKILVEHTFL